MRQMGVRRVARKIRAEIRGAVCAIFSRRWDRKNGVDTSGHIAVADLDVVGSNQGLGHGAVSTSPKTFQYFSRYFPANRGEFTYIDMGCGKGRTLLLASTMGFRRVIGVEFAPLLCEVARSNLKQFCRARGLGEIGSVVDADATEYRLPDDNLVIYFGNPFFPELWPRMVANLVRGFRERPRKVYVVMAGSALSSFPEYKKDVAKQFVETGVFRETGSGVAPFFLDTYQPFHYSVFETREV